MLPPAPPNTGRFETHVYGRSHSILNQIETAGMATPTAADVTPMEHPGLIGSWPRPAGQHRSGLPETRSHPSAAGHHHFKRKPPGGLELTLTAGARPCTTDKPEPCNSIITTRGLSLHPQHNRLQQDIQLA